MTMCTRLMNGFEFDQPNLALIPLTTDCGLFGMCVLMEKEGVGSELGLGEKDISECNPLLTIVPSGLALSAKVHNKVVGLGSMLDISNWVKHKILRFSKLVGLPISCRERSYIPYL